MNKPIFAANWKMHLSPGEAEGFLSTFLDSCSEKPDREVWFFPAAVSLATVLQQVGDRSDIKVGVQNVHWEPKGAFTGEISAEMARDSGAFAVLIGHSERRHIFGETVSDTTKKIEAVLRVGLIPMLCVGETIEQREAGDTLDVVASQLEALDGLGPEVLSTSPIAYEPVWAIGTGKTATPSDAQEVHSFIRKWLEARGVSEGDIRVLYGGSVKPENSRSLMIEPDVSGVLVGGASLDPTKWSKIVLTDLD